jgi:glyoxylase-like metal-dependent hydrolase (beta-lactamase superfamily II)
MTLSIDMFAAGAGDAFVVCAGIDGGRRWIAVVDGGPPGTPDQGLKQFLWQVATPPSSARASAYVDLLAVTHIDSDHIGGAIDLMADTPPVSRKAVAGFTFGTVWHNSFSELTGDSALIASGQIRLGVQARLTKPEYAADDRQRAVSIVASVTQGQDLRDLIASNLGLSRFGVVRIRRSAKVPVP